MDVLTEFLAGLDVSGPEAVAAAIRGRFIVIDRDRLTNTQREPEIGQVWRNKESGRLVRIDRFSRSDGLAHRVLWTALNGNGPKTGRPHKHYWQSRFEFVADSEADL